jgi:predicted nucleic acid-binding protein
MVVGLDTGFFVELMRQNPAATTTWKALIESDSDQGIVCSLTLFEIERLRLKGSIPSESDFLLEAIPEICTVRWIDDVSILTRAASLAHGLGIPAVDATILAVFTEADASVICTTDSHFERFLKKGVRILNLLTDENPYT